MLIAMYVEIDDFVIANRQTIQQLNRELGIVKNNYPTTLSLSEMMTIIIHFQRSGYRTFKTYYTEYVTKRLRDCFPRLVSYQRFVELKPRTLMPLLMFLNRQQQKTRLTGVNIIDSFPLRACRNQRIGQHRVMKGIAQRGRTSMGWFYGMKVHLIVNEHGELVNSRITAGNVADNDARLLHLLTKRLNGLLIGDKGYICGEEKKKLLEKDNRLKLVTKPRANMRRIDYRIDELLWLSKRGVVESSIALIKETFQAEHTRHRSATNCVVNIYAALIAYTYHPTKPSAHVYVESRMISGPTAEVKAA